MTDTGKLTEVDNFTKHRISLHSQGSEREKSLNMETINQIVSEQLKGPTLFSFNLSGSLKIADSFDVLRPSAIKHVSFLQQSDPSRKHCKSELDLRLKIDLRSICSKRTLTCSEEMKLSSNTGPQFLKAY